MAAAAEVLAGTAVKFGIGATTFTVGLVIAATGMNIQGQELEDGMKIDKIISQNGATIETKVASQRERKATFKIIPKGANRAAAITVIGLLEALTPLEVITIATSDIPAYNGTWNYEGGHKLTQTAEGWAVSDLVMTQVEDAANANQFLGLAIV